MGFNWESQSRKEGEEYREGKEKESENEAMRIAGRKFIVNKTGERARLFDIHSKPPQF